MGRLARGSAALAGLNHRLDAAFGGGRLDWNRLIRQAHRWLSIAFTVAVIANIVALGKGTPGVWVGLVALLPLALLLITGLYLFVLPYATRRRSERDTA